MKHSTRSKGETTEPSPVLKTIPIFILAFLLITSFSLTGFSGLSVTPLLLDLTITPGGSGRGTLTVQNTGEESIRINSQVRGFKTSDKGVAKFLSAESAHNYPFSGEKLLTLNPEEVVLGPGESKKFTYEVSYPRDTDPFGGRYVGALFKATPVREDQAEQKGSSIKVATRVGTLILIRPSEEILIGEEFREFQVKPEIKDFYARTVYSGNRLLIHTLLKNSGNIHIRKKEFTGKIHLKDSSGALIEEISISPHNVLPATSYALTELWEIPDKIKKGDKEVYTVKVFIEVKTPYGKVIKIKKTQSIQL